MLITCNPPPPSPSAPRIPKPFPKLRFCCRSRFRTGTVRFKVSTSSHGLKAKQTRVYLKNRIGFGSIVYYKEPTNGIANCVECRKVRAASSSFCGTRGAGAIGYSGASRTVAEPRFGAAGQVDDDCYTHHYCYYHYYH